MYICRIYRPLGAGSPRDRHIDNFRLSLYKFAGKGYCPVLNIHPGLRTTTGQKKKMIYILIRYRLYMTVDKLVMIPDSQDGPVYPGAHVHMLGLTQVPPFLQPLLHTAATGHDAKVRD